MKQKIISFGALLIFFVSFGYLFGGEYWDFQETQTQEHIFQSQSSQSIKDFSLETLPEFGSDITLHETPNRALLESLVSYMDAAKEKIYVEIYIFTERDMRDALIRAHKRGVEIKVLLENNPYQAPYLNDETFEILEAEGIDVRWSDPLLYSLNHSKLLMIDERAFISTGNFSYALFTKNKDFLLEFRQDSFIRELEELFLHDYRHELGGTLQENLVVSPYNSRQKLEYLIHSADKTIDFYFPYLQDTGFESLLFEKAKAGVKIRGIVDKKFYDENLLQIEKYKEQGITLTPLKHHTLHTKMILVDATYMYLGSINFSKYSMDENREIGVILSDKNIISQMQNIFASDF